ncbi:MULTISPECIES: RNA 2'-phosphotransferase [unclassified Ensifer]|uniref:RNA 2'-phosphotransferase n=1 Tax=unclassified Ensifer TaxID=2633371 RepID=UPI000812E6C6|nr:MULTISPECIES: RNA 2'-phosphotransferase [unclassified Ensifer]OCP03419.1 RNA 2'-phosphotransferase [Ensifer sp. LC11]OCP03783.1 RNA 2'-phosphotransferase [Ensifer sp. LC13]OCP08482.1 RNA 2'-phosphotransferase [Ensifer sp. LC14]OCP30254.1 RNA 2'-phosphotransferase [Ensifer sp. LC499]
MSAQDRDTAVSKFMSYVLRHAPQEAGLELDSQGWVAFSDLTTAIRTRFDIGNEDLLRLIEQNPKKRFTLAGGRIRAAQGHSVAVDIGLEAQVPPKVLFHGTQADRIAAIMDAGLLKMERQHVHLSMDPATAKTVAKRRRGQTAILKIDAERMHSDGGVFFLSENDVWLTETVKPEYISPLTETEL